MLVYGQQEKYTAGLETVYLFWYSLTLARILSATLCLTKFSLWRGICWPCPDYSKPAISIGNFYATISMHDRQFALKQYMQRWAIEGISELSYHNPDLGQKNGMNLIEKSASNLYINQFFSEFRAPYP